MKSTLLELRGREILLISQKRSGRQMQLTQRASDSNHPRTTKQNQTGTLILPSELILFEMRPNAIL